MALPSIVENLLDIVDPQSQSFYLQVDHGPHLRLNIHRMTEDMLYVSWPNRLQADPQVHGFLVAKDGRGIYVVDGVLQGSIEKNGMYDIIPIRIDLQTARFENQRNFFRVRFKEPIKATFSPIAAPAVHLEMSVLDFSAGGMRIRSPRPLQKGEHFHIHFKPMCGSQSYEFQFQGEVVSDLGQSSGNDDLKGCYGIWILCSQNPSMDEIKALDFLQRRILKFCNDYVAWQTRHKEKE